MIARELEAFDSFEMPRSIALVVVVFGTMVAFAWLWHETKKRHPKTFDRVRYALMALVVLVFFAR